MIICLASAQIELTCVKKIDDDEDEDDVSDRLDD